MAWFKIFGEPSVYLWLIMQKWNAGITRELMKKTGVNRDQKQRVRKDRLVVSHIQINTSRPPFLTCMFIPQRLQHSWRAETGPESHLISAHLSSADWMCDIRLQHYLGAAAAVLGVCCIEHRSFGQLCINSTSAMETHTRAAMQIFLSNNPLY